MNPDAVFIELRKKAEKILNDHVDKSSDFVDMDFLHLIQELQTYQTELELQNEELQLAKKKIEESHNKYFELYDSAPVGLVTVNSKGLITQANKAASAMLCSPGEILIGKGFSQCLLPEDHGTYFSCLRKVSDFGDRNSCEVCLIRNGRELVCVRIETSAHFDDEGNILEWRFALSDITNQETAKEKLLQLKEYYRSLVEEQIELVSRIKPDGTFLYANSGYCRFFGTQKEELEGSKWQPVAHPDDLLMIEEQISQLCPEKPVVMIENRVHDAKGEIRWVQFSNRAFFDDKGVIQNIQSVGRDITERKQVEDALRQSREDLKRAQETGQLGSWRLDTRRNILTWSDMNHRIFGVPEGTPLTYEMFLGIVHPDDRQYVDKQWQAALRGEPYDLEHRIVVDGKVKWVREKAYLEFDSEGQLLGGFGITQDITERKLVEENLRKAHENLEIRVKERTAELERRAGQLARMSSELTLAEQRERRRIANVLHDNLQQLLVGAKINSEVLSAQIGQKHKELTENILNLINQSIQSSRSLTSEISPPVLRQGLSAVLQWICRHTQENHGLKVELKTDASIDPRREDITILLYQSVRELLLNVVKHAGVKSARVEMGNDQEQLRVTVSDDGSGFDPATVQEMEDNRYGLLSIRERLELIGGSLQIESAPGKGASFSVLVPLEIRVERDEEDIQKIINKIQKAKIPGNIIRVLLVDDHTVVRQGLSTMLNLCSEIEIVDEVADGEEAVKKARELQPDVILMDISMPKMDGVEATRIISSELPHIRIIGLSMHDKSDQAHRMLEAGASAYCTKDGDTNLLLSAIFGGTK